MLERAEAIGGAVLGIGATVIMIAQPSFVSDLPDISKAVIWSCGALLMFCGMGAIVWPRLVFLHLWGKKPMPEKPEDPNKVVGEFIDADRMDGGGIEGGVFKAGGKGPFIRVGLWTGAVIRNARFIGSGRKEVEGEEDKKK